MQPSPPLKRKIEEVDTVILIQPLDALTPEDSDSSPDGCSDSDGCSHSDCCSDFYYSHVSCYPIPAYIESRPRRLYNPAVTMPFSAIAAQQLLSQHEFDVPPLLTRQTRSSDLQVKAVLGIGDKYSFYPCGKVSTIAKYKNNKLGVMCWYYESGAPKILDNILSDDLRLSYTWRDPTTLSCVSCIDIDGFRYERRFRKDNTLKLACIRSNLFFAPMLEVIMFGHDEKVMQHSIMDSNWHLHVFAYTGKYLTGYHVMDGNSDQKKVVLVDHNYNPGFEWQCPLVTSTTEMASEWPRYPLVKAPSKGWLIPTPKIL